MDTDPGPFEESDCDCSAANTDYRSFSMAVASGTLTTGDIIIRQPHSFLLPDLTFVASQVQTRISAEDSGKDSSGLEIEGGGRNPGRVEIEGDHNGVSGFEKHSGVARIATEISTMRTVTNYTPGARAEAEKGDEGESELENRGATEMRVMEDTKRIAATWNKTPTIRPAITTTIKTSTVKLNYANLSTPKYSNKSWSSEDSNIGGVMLNSLKPRGRQASSLVSTAPIRHEIVTGSEWRVLRDQSISPTNDGDMQDLPSATPPTNHRVKQDSSNAVGHTNHRVIYYSPAVVTPSNSRAIQDSPGAGTPSNSRAIQDSPGAVCPSNSRVIHNSLSVVAPTNNEVIQDSPGSVSPAPLHFHRKSRHAQHDNHQSVTPGPSTCTKTRKYKLLHTPDTPLTRRQKAEPDIEALTDNLQNLTLRRPTPWVYSPAAVRKALSQWKYDEQWMENAERLEAKNRFRGIDLNYGWNRAAANLINSTKDAAWVAPYFEGGPEMRMKITEALSRFSLWSQLEPIEWDAEELKGMFDMVFVGEGLGNSGWARKPGSWWGTRKKLFDGHRGRTFLEELDLWVKEIEDGREKWKQKNKGKLFALGSLKRKTSSAKAQVDVEGDGRRKRIKMPKTKAEQVMSEEWRARRRVQEKNAGRWTDGTLRMDRMWAAFHWVLNTDDPNHYLDRLWPKEIFTRS
ncbi:uncharacterized protein K444DRAFT_669685 [Hyaloscypha bicolor E]|uniref:Uncharacterized protein n=1 Tax=Hyaloscypha bicolor E TaxID=1095630 RepID=A0A2J6SML9_9HELO|nr:uncharacterized protein K444DRAFT_669685 [Hyaloscypha bicolor E]PMD52021.1 hypothetical protein K444DRAFT_669685 [Hyaloscypha bicolor E]